MYVLLDMISIIVFLQGSCRCSASLLCYTYQFLLLHLLLHSSSFSLLCKNLIKLCSHIFQDATRIILHMAPLHLCSTQQQGVLQTGERTAMHSCPWLMPLVLTTGATISTAMDYYIKIYPRTPPIHGLLLTCRGLTTLLMLLQQ